MTTAGVDVIGGDPGRVPQGVALDNWQSATHLHWAFQHIAEFLPTATISRGAGPVANFTRAPQTLTGVPLTGVDGAKATVGDVIARTATDGWMVSRNGQVIAEEYAGGMNPATSHLLMSVSKSLVATVIGVLRDAGLVDVNALVTNYVPALESSGYTGAIVQNLLDMRSGIAFSENYLDPSAEVRVLEEAFGWAPKVHPGVPGSMYEFLTTLRQKGPHGGPFEYRSCETDVLGWICEAVTGERMSDLMSRVLWSRLGAERDATIGVDSEGTGMFDGGINACLADLVRFGYLYLRDGVSLTGEPIVSESWIADTWAGGPDSRAAFAATPDDTWMPGGMYRNQVWFPYPGDTVMLCLGIHGQMIYVNRAAGVVAAKLSSWPLPQDGPKLFDTIRAFDAISSELSES